MVYLQTYFLPDLDAYDLIRGYRADDSYFSFARAFVGNAISYRQLSEAMYLGELGEQIVLHSDTAFERILFERFEPAGGRLSHDKGYAGTWGLARFMEKNMKTAILVDGGFYRKRALHQWGYKTSEKRAAELYAYCNEHLRHQQKYEPERTLYRIFYYDCPPLGKTVYHPLLQRGIDYILDPMGADVKPSLFEHIDGLNSVWKKHHL